MIVSYYQGGRAITYIVEKWGYDKVLDMIHDYANRMTTPQVIEKELKIKPEDFDKQFLPVAGGADQNHRRRFRRLGQRRAQGINATPASRTTRTGTRSLKKARPFATCTPDYVEAGQRL